MLDREMTRRIVEQCDQLAKDRIVRNARIKRLEDAITMVIEQCPDLPIDAVRILEEARDDR